MVVKGKKRPASSASPTAVKKKSLKTVEVVPIPVSSPSVSDEASVSDVEDFSSDSESDSGDQPQEAKERFSGEVDVDDVIKEVLQVSTTKVLKQAFRKLAECWVMNQGVLMKDEADKVEPKMKAFVGLRALLDIASETSADLGIMKKKDHDVTPKQLVAKLLKQLFDIIGNSAKGSRLHWHTHQNFGFLSNGLSHMISRHIGTGSAYIMLFTAIKDLGLVTREPIVLSAKPKPGKKKDVAKMKQKISDAEGVVYNWKHMIQIQIVLDVLANCRTELDTLQKSKKDESELIKAHEDMLLLCYPLYSALMACLKYKWGKQGYASFNCQLLRRLVELQAKSQSFVPVGVPLSQMMEQLVNIALQSKRVEKGELKKDSGIAYTALRLSESQVRDAQIADDLWQHFMVTLTMYASSLSAHPAFPEMIVPLGNTIRALQKSKTKLPTTYSKTLDQFMKASKTTSEKIKLARDNLDIDEQTDNTMAVMVDSKSAMSNELRRVLQAEGKALKNMISS